MKNNITTLLLILLIAVFSTSCRHKKSKVQFGSEESIVSLSPNITETLFAIGAGDLIVGVTSYCDYPSEAKEIESIGSIMEPDIEKIISLSPTLVITTGTSLQRTFENSLSAAGIRCESVRVNTLDDVLASITSLGALAGKEQEAAALHKTISDCLNQRHESEPARIMAVIQREPLIVAGRGTCIDSLISVAGGENACSESGYPVINAESLILMAPDIIIETADVSGCAADTAADNYYSLWLEDVSVYLADRNVLSRPGPRVCLAVKFIEDALACSSKVN